MFLFLRNLIPETLALDYLLSNLVKIFKESNLFSYFMFMGFLNVTGLVILNIF